jgi:dihydrofolate synthase/folylpolyglutamate synthase
MRFDRLADWLDWQSGLAPTAIDLGLDRVRRAWSALDGAPFDCPVITVAGTNGKGSSVAFADAILRAGGYRTGCYTSPHLQRYNERVRIDGEPVDDASLCRAFDAVDRARGDARLTYFEFGTLAALWLFRREPLDAVILEIGLGGRLDAVNIIDPDVALISSIGLDHQAWLGDDREQIGFEKAGILRGGRPAVFSGSDIPASVRTRASALAASLQIAGEDYRVERRSTDWDLICPGGRDRRALPIPALRGARQIDNAAGVLVALDALADRLPVDQRAVRSGLLDVRLPGRFEVRPGQPTWVLDVAHNPQSVEALDAQLADLFVPGRRLAVFGALDDKDIAGIGQILRDRFDAWYLVDLSDQPRGLAAGTLESMLQPVLGGRSMVVAGPVASTLARVSIEAAADDLIVVFGSFLTVGAARDWLDSVPGPA